MLKEYPMFLADIYEQCDCDRVVFIGGMMTAAGHSPTACSRLLSLAAVPGVHEMMKCALRFNQTEGNTVTVSD